MRDGGQKSGDVSEHSERDLLDSLTRGTAYALVAEPKGHHGRPALSVPTPDQAAWFHAQQYARCEPDEIAGVRQHASFVEVIDAPDESALGVTPCTEVLDMEITDGATEGACVS